GDGTLGLERPQSSAPTQYEFDPRDPVPSIGGNVSSQIGMMEAGAYDQRCRPNVLGCNNTRRLASRNDILVFETPPLREDMEVTGPLVVNLWPSSSAVDTHFTATLFAVYPPNRHFPLGAALTIADRSLRPRSPAPLEKATP